MDESLIANPDDSFSSLGENPVCDDCKKPIVAGDKVIQSFSGTVKKLQYSNGLADIEELVVEETYYGLVHVNCHRRVH